MRLIAFLLAVVVATCALILARSHAHRAKDVAPAPPAAAAALAARASTATAAVAVSPDNGTEPDEADLFAADTAHYEAIEKAGGLVLTVPQTGRSVPLHPKLWSLHKNSCKPGWPTGAWECDVTIDISLMPGGKYRGTQGERLCVKRGTDGWEAC
jgi:hypothetical protein